ncbi:RNA methyltransferase [Lutimonas saemankumensis]|uniref:TrmH family RNA methyltransferase n=1 Tax=Lutimonas saemankumensis TaxID=483016 RepID=UPI001CD79DFA|nr:RNA methyltransferase [Lutimonas saemankumensis]MCA0932886.1 RNA methyltransferase [Lutimonas saemankumensis]
MLSKNQIKFIRSLKKKKFRQAEKLFLAEGIKVVEELLASAFELHRLYATSSYKNPFKIKDLTIIEEKELAMISDFTNPNQVFGIFKIPSEKDLTREGLTLVLDGVNDPGNLGTIIRLCDWFGVRQIVCSENTVDCYNQKVVQASMGSLTRVSVSYLDLAEYLRLETRMIYGTLLDGENIYQLTPEENAVLILGNEANGISEEVKRMIRQKLTIPQFGETQKTESLNVAMAAAIFLSEFRR